MLDDITALISGSGPHRVKNRRRLSCVHDDISLSSEPLSRTGLSKSLGQLIEYKRKEARVSSMVIDTSVRDLCIAYNELSRHEKFDFLQELSRKHGTDAGNVNECASSLLSSDAENRLELESQLCNALVPDYHWIFLQMGKLENGVKFLVDLRSDLIELCKSEGKSSELKHMNENLRDLISVWFSAGFLRLERMTWGSPCDMLEKVSEYEAVHPMKNWSDLKLRVGTYRRCYVFTHGSMPTEPVVVLHTALLQNIPSTISSIVQANNENQSPRSRRNSTDGGNFVEDPSHIQAAIFYSITSTQNGLLGIELGNYLIKRVVKELQTEFPKMSKFSSLSPIPGFRSWLLSGLKKETELLTANEQEVLRQTWNLPEDGNVTKELISALESLNFANDDELAAALEQPLMRLCAVYLAETKRNGYAYDPVAHFHLKNGAVMWRINWLGDLSAKGLKQSCGIMVNYRYFLEDCEKNSRLYVEHQHLSTSQSVRNMLGGVRDV